MPPAQRRKRRKPAGEYRPPAKRGESAPQPARSRRPGAPERPPAPWGRFPLVELVVLIATVMMVLGFLAQGTRGVTLILAGLALGMLAGFELAVREHFAGYRSHTTVLAGAPAVVVLGLGAFFLPTGWPRVASFAAAILVFLVGAYLLREAFKRRSGGLGFKVR